MFKTFTHHPIRSRSVLLKALTILKPLLHQINCVGYSFVFQLPAPFLTLLASGGNYSFLKMIHRIAAGKDLQEHGYTTLDAADAMASTIGPGPSECKTFLDENSKQQYPPSVGLRAKSNPPATFFLDQTAYYRDNTFSGSWTKSLESLTSLHTLSMNNSSAPLRRASSGAGLFEDGPSGALKAKATILWGQKDGALVEEVVLHGIGDYLCGDSQVVLLPRTGHFTPIERESRAAFERVVRWAVEGEMGDVGEAVKEVYHDASVCLRK